MGGDDDRRQQATTLRWALIGPAAIVVVGLAMAVPMVWLLLGK
jgi:hypothetical protein